MTNNSGRGRRQTGWEMAGLWWRVLRISYLRYYSSGGYFMAAAVAFYSLICLAPLGIIFAKVLQHLLGGGSEAYRALHEGVRAYGGPEAEAIMQQINGLLESTSSHVTSVVSIAAVVWAGLRLFDAVQVSLTFIWPGRRLRAFLVRKLVSLAMMAVAGLLLAALVLSHSLLAGIRGWLAQFPGVDLQLVEPLRPLGNLGLSFLVSASSYLLLYKTMPVQKVDLRAAVAGALCAATLWQAALPVFVYLMARGHDLNWFYGGLGWVVLVGLWAFMGAQVLLFGAQFTAAYEHVLVHRRSRGEDRALIEMSRRRLQMTRLPDVSAEAEHVLGELQPGPAAEAGVNAIILSGGAVPSSMVEKLGAELRGLIPVAGRPSIEHVVAALRGVPEVRKIVVLGDREAYLHSPIADRVDGIVEEGPDIAYNLLRAIRFLGESRKVLLAAADMPLVSSAALQAFLAQCDPAADLCYPVTRRAEAQRLGRYRHWALMPLQDGWVTLTCHVLVDPALALRNQEFVEHFLSRDKDLFAAAGQMGAGFMLRDLLSWYLPGLRYDLETIGRRIEAVTGARQCQAVVLDHPEIALGLDRPAQVQEAEARLREAE